MNADSHATIENPLLAAADVPSFAAIRAEHVEPAVRHVLASQREALRRAQSVRAPTVGWLAELETIHENVHRVWGPVSHLNSVASTPELRAAFNRCLPLVTEFETELGQNDALYAGYERVERSLPTSGTTEARLVAHYLRELRLAGVALEGAAKQRFAELTLRLAGLTARFEQNLMDATDAFAHVVQDSADLAGLPESTIERARRSAHEHGLEGFRLTLDPPTYQTVLTHADDAALRELYYRAWMTRASELGPSPHEWDNGPLIDEILQLRHEAAHLLGFANYAETSLETKMAESPEAVRGFLRDLAARSRPRARAELDELTEFAGRTLEAWDVAYFGERLKQHRFGLAEEQLRPYFPLPHVLGGLFALTERLFGVTIEPRPALAQDTWHASVQVFALVDVDGADMGALYTDLYARPNKRGGAWMDVGRNRSRTGALTQKPIAFLVCNFAPPIGETPSLLTHSDVVTLFHEFGHSLHHLLTEVDYPSLAGINGVAWDAVEMPSQFLENFAWLPGVLKQISSHHETGAPLPDETIEKLDGSRTFLSGLAMVRQIEFALFDLELHSQPEPLAAADVARVLADVRAEVAVIEPPAYNRFPNTFAHVFGGGYAAGYYSYKWAEVLAADAFAAFEENGVFDAETAARFRRAILATGGSRDALDSFIEFRGRAPELAPLLRRSGIEQ